MSFFRDLIAWTEVALRPSRRRVKASSESGGRRFLRKGQHAKVAVEGGRLPRVYG
jgi:hypothetical protein